eukprot:CAMPEP_0177645832 /NCGR_PEP_ID=MMETSP0447-20121125/9457_1 /TAXON_ID=0 /ORGANISM="Stygamoeba regulata, Strain BSH-02190019" /LENGTH=201 /DNA_ID=CAMNT_0019148337 /DNA_START=61 /DNA_END=666 /DNA_ORIENTATION=+
MFRGLSSALLVRSSTLSSVHSPLFSSSTALPELTSSFSSSRMYSDLASQLSHSRLTCGELLRTKSGALYHVDEDVSMEECAKKMLDNNIGSLLVRSPEGRVVGIVSERDYLKTAKKHISIHTPVKKVMTPRDKIIRIPRTATLNNCMELMSEHHIRHLCVYDGGIFHGVLSIKDIVNAMVSDHENTIARLEQFITGRAVGY